jgi:hypothetical protein
MFREMVEELRCLDYLAKEIERRKFKYRIGEDPSL